MTRLFSNLSIRGETFKNRIFIAPMCLYSATDGVPNEWHLVHLGSQAIGGAGLVMAEATSVTAEGRITPGDTGLWNDTQTEAFAKITSFIRLQGSVPAIQLAHAGRKASTDLDWLGGKPLTPDTGAWQTVGPSTMPFGSYPAPRELGVTDLADLCRAFEHSAKLSLEAGFGVLELHMAHGYLLHSFLSPLANHRTDAYGGSFENRIRFPVEIIRAVRKVWPENKPLFVRISATDWLEGGWDLSQSIEFSHRIAQEGVDLIDCSSGGIVPHAKIPTGRGYQVPLSAGIRKATGLRTGAVGLITEAEHAEQILKDGEADVVFIARESLRNPNWPLLAAHTLGAEANWPPQYFRAKPQRS